MPQLEPLNIKITGSSEGLSSALAGAQRDTQRFAQGLGDSSGKAAGLFASIMGMANPATLALAGLAAAGAAAGAAVAVGVAKTREQFEVVDELSDAANRLGVSFNELKGLRLAIGQATGLEGEQVDAAIAKLQLNLSEAALEQSGRVYDRIKSLGLDAKKLLEAGPTEAIEAIGAKVAELKDPTDQMKVAFDLFGKSGVGFVNALREGPGALREIIERTKEQAGLTDAQVEAIGSANDAWEDLGVLVDGIFQKIAAELAPMIQVIAEDSSGIAEGFKNVNEWARYATDTVAELYGVSQDAVELLSSFNPISQISRLLEGDFKAIAASVDKGFTFDAADRLRERLAKIREENEAASGKDKVSEAELAALEAQQKASEEAERAAEQWSKKADALRASLATPMERYEQTVNELQQALDKGGLEWDVFARGVEKAAADLAKAEDSAAGIRPPQLLSAVTDRAAQIRLAAQMTIDNQKQNQERERTQLLKEQLATAKQQRDLLRQLAAQEHIEPAPINL